MVFKLLKNIVSLKLNCSNKKIYFPLTLALSTTVKITKNVAGLILLTYLSHCIVCGKLDKYVKA
jgi:hypothetical protein